MMTAMTMTTEPLAPPPPEVPQISTGMEAEAEALTRLRRRAMVSASRGSERGQGLSPNRPPTRSARANPRLIF